MMSWHVLAMVKLHRLDRKVWYVDKALQVGFGAQLLIATCEKTGYIAMILSIVGAQLCTY
jgi:hypothetical protein